jgi:hypothetical protein
MDASQKASNSRVTMITAMKATWADEGGEQSRQVSAAVLNGQCEDDDRYEGHLGGRGTAAWTNSDSVNSQRH